MSRMLPFAFPGTAVEVARSRAAVGRNAAAVAALEAALGSGQLSQDAAVDAHRTAAGLYRDAEKYGKARKHLRAALALAPRDAGLHHGLGVCLQDDPYGCDRRAAARFRAAVVFAPDHAGYRAAFGLALVRTNRVKAGLRELKRAAETAPADAAVLGVVLDGLREAGRSRLAPAWLSATRFAGPALKRVWDRARFDAVRESQGAKIGRGPVRRATMPFVRVATGSAAKPVGGGVVRADAASRSVPHLGRLRAFRAEQG